jgi:hypothetical protein
MSCPIPNALSLNGPVTWLVFVNIPVLACLLAYCGGLQMAKSNRRNLSGEPSEFIFLRPLDTWTLAMAQWQGAAAATLVAGVAFVALAPAAFHVFLLLGADSTVWPSWSNFAEHHAPLVRWAGHPATVLAALAVAWRWIMLGLRDGSWPPHGLLWARRLARAGGHAAVVFLPMWGVAKPEFGLDLLRALPWIAGLLVVVKLADATRATFTLVEAQSGSTSSSRVLGLAYLGWYAVVFGAAYSFHQTCGLPPELGYFVAAYLMPGGEWPDHVMRLRALRHR